MPLILAIEPDKRQAAQLKVLVKNRLGADLILADTTELALEAIGDRIPDLVLVPALLSPAEDGALAAALRVIAHAAHVQTLTIPVFASPQKSRAIKTGGLLSKLIGGNADGPPEGCDPAVFGDQIAAYLAEAAANREARGYESEQFDTFDEPQAPAPAFARVETFSFQPSSDSQPAPEGFDGEGDVAAEPQSARPDYDPFGPIDSSLLPESARRGEPARPPEKVRFEPKTPIVRPAPAPNRDERRPIAALPERTTPAKPPAPQPVPEFHDFDLASLIAKPAQEAEPVEEPIVLEPIDPDIAAAGFDHSVFDALTTRRAEPAAAAEPEAAPEEDWFPPKDQSIAIDLPSPDELPVRKAPETFETPTPPAQPTSWSELPVARRQTWPQLEGITAEPTPADLLAEFTEDLSRSASQRAVAASPAPPPPPAAAPAKRSVTPPPATPPSKVLAPRPRPVAPSEPPPVAPAAERPQASEHAAESSAKPASATRAKSQRPEWTALIDSLRQDMERMRNERTQREQPEPEQPSWSAFSKASQTPAPARAASPKPAIAKQETAPEPAASAADATPNAADAAKRKKRPQKPTPVQDEWGFFDPEQCGFAALLAKLDEITEKEEAFD